MVTDVLSAFKQIAFDHNTFDQFVEIRIVVAAVKYFAYDTNLFFELLAGVGMVYIYDGSWIFEIFFAIQVIKTHQIFIMIVWNTGPVFINAAPENHVGKLISVGIVLASVVLNFLMFGDPDIFNILINIVLVYFLFFKKIRRNT